VLLKVADLVRFRKRIEVFCWSRIGREFAAKVPISSESHLTLHPQNPKIRQSESSNLTKVSFFPDGRQFLLRTNALSCEIHIESMPGTSGYRQVTLFSETDIHGTITFVNDMFCLVSKYTREELVGKPHNIVRHPDMPKKLFQLWWSAIKKGEVFRAIVKNRAKDGSHYWVQATIMPVLNKHNEVIKYIAARHLITDETKAQELYREQVKLLRLDEVASEV